MIPTNNWLYALECVLLPVLWGLLMVGATDLVEKFFTKRHQASNPPITDEVGNERRPLSPEYHI